MVVCPATNANLINHCGPLVKGEGACQDGVPNAKVQFATDFDPMTQEWLNMDLIDIKAKVKNKQRGISLEIVALRDIDADEEIFIDYGRAWEDAWLEHVRTWKPPKDEGFLAVSKMNKNISLHLRTEDELEANPYPHDVRVGCFVHGFFHPCKIIQRLSWTEADLPSMDENGDFFPGQRKPDRSPQFKVKLYKQTREGTWEFRYKWHFSDKSVFWFLSSKHIRFFPGAYNSDLHMPGTFRHSIHAIADEEWPEQWKNMK